ncbi:hypothetical protein HDR60_03605 [bacterium]|nr:hypothetical protein [bacterium]
MVKNISDEIEFMQDAQLALNKSFNEDIEISEQQAMQNTYQDLRNNEKVNPISKFIENIRQRLVEKKISKEFINRAFLNNER